MSLFKSVTSVKQQVLCFVARGNVIPNKQNNSVRNYYKKGQTSHFKKAFKDPALVLKDCSPKNKNSVIIHLPSCY